MTQLKQPKPSNVDWMTLLIYFACTIWGLICIYASVYKDTHPLIYDQSMNYGKQLTWMGISFFIGMLILLIDEKFFYAFAYPIYGITILLLLAVLAFSVTVKGSSSWIEIGGFRMQPAEFAKFGTSLALAKLLSGYNTKFTDPKIRNLSLLLVFIPPIIILLQNETGSALVFASFILVFYREGLPGYFLFIGAVVALIAVLALIVPAIYIYIIIGVFAAIFTLFIRRNIKNVLIVGAVAIALCALAGSVDYVFENVLQPHQKQRINVLLGKEVDLKGAGYNVQQSKIAIGSGGLMGKGFLEGTQNKFRFVPEQSTDFIFCTIGEEYGFIGTSVFIILYMLLLWRILYLAERQKQKFNRIYGYCVASILFFHFFVNIGMTIGLIPVIGIPLPFFSYGGSALLSFTILLFIFIRLDSNRLNELKGAYD
jgi:rod shape determining protein RodA